MRTKSDLYVVGPYLQEHVGISYVHTCMVLFWTKCACMSNTNHRVPFHIFQKTVDVLSV